MNRRDAENAEENPEKKGRCVVGERCYLPVLPDLDVAEPVADEPGCLRTQAKGEDQVIDVSCPVCDRAVRCVRPAGRGLNLLDGVEYRCGCGGRVMVLWPRQENRNYSLEPHANRRVTAEQMNEMLRLRGQGLTYRAVAAEMGVSMCTAMHYIKMLTAEKAENRE